MRHIGLLADEGQARRFEGYLLTRGIRANVETEDGQWAVWIYDEDHVAPARDELARFRENPADGLYDEAAEAARGMKRKEHQESRRQRRKVVDVRQQWNRPLSAQAPLAHGLIAICVAVAFVSTDWSTPFDLCDKLDPILTYMFIAPVFDRGGGTVWIPIHGLDAIGEGQVWRLVTPMLIHFGPIHLLFNMLWLRDLGSAIEVRRGHLRFALMVLFISALSNAAEYAFDFPLQNRPSPFFGGMSGVVFGAFGYVWMKSRFDAASGFFMPPTTVFLMMFWFLLCTTGAVGPIANMAHGVGLVSGMVLGYAPKLWRDMLRGGS